MWRIPFTLVVGRVASARMQNCRDTFIRYLSDNLPNVNLHAVRQDKDNPANSLVQMNSLNVQFLSSAFSNGTAKQLVSLDVTADNERDAVNTAQVLSDLLRTNASIPKMHYAAGINGLVSATPTGSFIYWNPNAVNFKTIVTDGNYYRFNLILPLQHLLSTIKE